MEMEDWETTDVVICGCGPTGAMLSAYLGQMSVPNVVLEREAEITTDPRGIALDEDGIRFLQGAGIYDSIFSEIGSCQYHFLSFPFYDWVVNLYRADLVNRYGQVQLYQRNRASFGETAVSRFRL